MNISQPILCFILILLHLKQQKLLNDRYVETYYKLPSLPLYMAFLHIFSLRNIHFYVNRLKFHIVEFYNYENPDPNSPNDYIGQKDEGMFRFIKYM